VGLERGPLSLVRIIEELLESKVAAPIQKTEINGPRGFVALTTRHPLTAKVGKVDGRKDRKKIYSTKKREHEKVQVRRKV
jgi:hypothetical protein